MGSHSKVSEHSLFSAQMQDQIVGAGGGAGNALLFPQFPISIFFLGLIEGEKKESGLKAVTPAVSQVS